MRAISDERGESLLEVVAAVTILGIAGVAMILGVGTASRLSGDDRHHAEALVVLSRAAEAVKAHRPDAVTCQTVTAETYAPALEALGDLPPGWDGDDVRIASVACVAANGVTAPQVTIEARPPGADPARLAVVPRLS